MKNLYLAILLLAFATNLLAFDKVWELQFSSTPHHVHYTEGHKELIVGEGNTFKKYNAETGALIDSVVYSLDALKDYTIGEFHVTDDLKSLYVLAMLKDDNKNEFVFRVSIQNSNNFDSLYTQNYLDNSSSYVYINSIPGILNKVGKDKFIYSLNSNSNYAPIYTASSGIIRIFENNNIDKSGGSLRLIKYNSYKPTFLLSTTSYSSQKTGQNTYSSYSSSVVWTSPANKVTNLNSLENIDLKEIYVVNLSKNNKFIYYSNGNQIIRFDYLKNDKTPIYFKPTGILPLVSDNELILNNNGKLYHYNFIVNRYLDSIDLGNNNYYLTDLANDYLISANNDYITAYKSSANPNKVITYLKDTIMTKSVGDTITLNAISNLNPIKKEWDLGDGRMLNGDTIRFSYPKNGEYLVKYTSTYKDSVVNLTCKVKVLDTLALSLTHKVEFKNGKTILTVTSNKSDNYIRINYSISSRKGVNSYKVIDSTSEYMIWEIEASDLYSVAVKISNSIYEKSRVLEVLIPKLNIGNTEFVYENLPNFYDVKVEYNKDEDIYFYNANKKMSFNGKNNEISYLVEVDLNALYLKSDFALSYLSNIKKSFVAGNSYQYADDFSRAVINGYPKITGDHPSYIIDSDKQKLYVLDRTIKDTLGTPYFKDEGYASMINMNKVNDKYLYYGVYTNKKNVNVYFGAYLNSTTFSLLGNMPKEFYTNTIYHSEPNNAYMFSVNNNLNLFKLNSNLEIADTLTTQKYTYEMSKTMNSRYALALIDTGITKKPLYLYKVNLKTQTSELIKLDSTIQYHQIYQFNDSLHCLVGIKDSNLIIQTFKDSLEKSKNFKLNYSMPFKIISVAKENEIYLSYIYTVYGKVSTVSLIKTKGFASIIDSLSIVPPFEDKDKTFIVANDNSYGSIQQSGDYSAAKVIFKDSLDLSNSFVKIYTETGDEILTYSLSKDQKDLPIQTDKLYIGIYYVRILNKNEEHNLGKFIIVR